MNDVNLLKLGSRKSLYFTSPSYKMECEESNLVANVADADSRGSTVALCVERGTTAPRSVAWLGAFLELDSHAPTNS